MTKLEELKRSDAPFITAQIAGAIVGCDPDWIRRAARERPEFIPFPFLVIGRRVRIPRLPFIRWVEDGTAWPGGESA